MTDEELDEIEKRANAATPGPWYSGRDPSNDEIIYDFDPWTDANACQIGEIRHIEDIDFISHAREDVPSLIAEVRQLKAYSETLKASLTDMHIELGAAKQTIAQIDSELMQLKAKLEVIKTYKNFVISEADNLPPEQLEKLKNMLRSKQVGELKISET